MTTRRGFLHLGIAAAIWKAIARWFSGKPIESRPPKEVYIWWRRDADGEPYPIYITNKLREDFRINPSPRGWWETHTLSDGPIVWFSRKPKRYLAVKKDAEWEAFEYTEEGLDKLIADVGKPKENHPCRGPDREPMLGDCGYTDRGDLLVGGALLGDGEYFKYSREDLDKLVADVVESRVNYSCRGWPLDKPRRIDYPCRGSDREWLGSSSDSPVW